MLRRILIVEDDAMTRGLLQNILESNGFEVAVAASAVEARSTVDTFDPDGLVLDIDLGPGPTGFDIADALLKGRPTLAVLFLTHLPDSRFAGRSPQSLPKRAGYLHKEQLEHPERLVDTLDHLLRGETPPVRDDLDPGRRVELLTETQLAVMSMVAKGMTNQQIAEERGTSVRAVTEVVSRCFEALGIDDSSEGNARVLAVRQFMRTTGMTNLP